MAEEKPLMKGTEACKLLNMHPNTFRNRCMSGALPAVKIGGQWYVRRADLMKQLGFEVSE